MSTMSATVYLSVPFSEKLAAKTAERRKEWDDAMQSLPEDMRRNIDMSHMHSGMAERDGDAGLDAARARLISTMKGWNPIGDCSYQIERSAFRYCLGFTK